MVDVSDLVKHDEKIKSLVKDGLKSDIERKELIELIISSALREWKIFLQEKNFKERPGQWEYAERILKFLLSDDQILLNPGGMGLGKTISTAFALEKSRQEYDYVLVGTPTAPIKGIWGKELGLLGLKDETVLWFAKKDDCCIKQKIKPRFDPYKKGNCTDDCEFGKKIRQNKEYDLNEINHISKHLDFTKMSFAKEYYDKYYSQGYDENTPCLFFVINYMLNNRKYIVGDYFSFLMPGMFKMKIPHRNSFISILIIDEAHLLPARAKGHLSYKLNLTKMISNLTIRTGSLFNGIFNQDFLKYETTIKILKKICKKLEKIGKGLDGVESAYTYNNFINEYENQLKKSKEEGFEFDDFILLLSERAAIRGLNQYDDKKEIEIYIPKFFNEWKSKQNNVKYANFFQYLMYKDKNVYFYLNCQDPSDYLTNIFQKFNKVILNSGTINKTKFSFDLGLNNLKTKYEPMIESYKIQDRVIVYPEGNFNSGQRSATYNKYKKKIEDIIKKLKGRTLIFIQNKKDSIIIESQLKNVTSVVNLCTDNKNDFSEKLKEFNNIKNGVGIINTLGRAEGENFKNEIDQTSVSNAIIYGYPFPKRRVVYDHELKYYADKTKSKHMANIWLNYVDPIDRVYQASCRVKRDESDTPVIILWGTGFEGAYRYMPTELQGEKIYEKINGMKQYEHLSTKEYNQKLADAKTQQSDTIINKIKELQNEKT